MNRLFKKQDDRRGEQFISSRALYFQVITPSFIELSTFSQSLCSKVGTCRKGWSCSRKSNASRRREGPSAIDSNGFCEAPSICLAIIVMSQNSWRRPAIKVWNVSGQLTISLTPPPLSSLLNVSCDHQVINNKKKLNAAFECGKEPCTIALYCTVVQML